MDRPIKITYDSKGKIVIPTGWRRVNPNYFVRKGDKWAATGERFYSEWKDTVLGGDNSTVKSIINNQFLNPNFYIRQNK